MPLIWYKKADVTTYGVVCTLPIDLYVVFKANVIKSSYS